MSAQKNADIMMQILHAIEERQLDRLPALFHPEIESTGRRVFPTAATSRGRALQR